MLETTDRSEIGLRNDVETVREADEEHLGHRTRANEEAGSIVLYAGHDMDEREKTAISNEEACHEGEVTMEHKLLQSIRLWTSLNTSTVREFFRDVKGKLRYFCADHDTVHQSTAKMDQEKTYEPPDENFITVGAERFCCAEVLLLPNFKGEGAIGIHDTSLQSNMKCGVYTCKNLYAMSCCQMARPCSEGFLRAWQRNRRRCLHPRWRSRTFSQTETSLSGRTFLVAQKCYSSQISSVTLTSALFFVHANVVPWGGRPCSNRWLFSGWRSRWLLHQSECSRYGLEDPSCLLSARPSEFFFLVVVASEIATQPLHPDTDTALLSLYPVSPCSSVKK